MRHALALAIGAAAFTVFGIFGIDPTLKEIGFMLGLVVVTGRVLA